MSGAGTSKNYRGTYTAGKLKLKKSIFKSDKPKTKKKAAPKVEVDEDQLQRGGWRRITDETDLKGGIDVAIECGDFSRCYLSAQDNGRFIIGAKRFIDGEAPNAEEILQLIKTPDDPKMSLKTGFGKYVGVDAGGNLVAVADAIGPRERFEVIFQDDKCAIQSASSGLFLSLNVSDANVGVTSRKVGPDEIVNIRTIAEKVGPTDFGMKEDLQAAGECETTYTKMYQHSRVDIKNKMISYNVNDKAAVRRAQQHGNLHETLLDRRAKLKSDKYC